MTRRAVKCRGIPQLLVVALLVLPLYFTRPSMARSTPTVLRGSGLELVGRDGVAWFRVSRKDGVAVLELSDVSGKTRFSVLLPRSFQIQTS